MNVIATSKLALLVQVRPQDAESLRQGIEPSEESSIRWQSINYVETALARLAGGGVDVVLLDLSVGLEHFLQMRVAAPDVPIVVLYDPLDLGVALEAMREGAADTLQRGQCGGSGGKVLRTVLQRKRNVVEPSGPRIPDLTPQGTVIALLGAKGGVGTTTVALNVASVLSRQHKVILAEMRPAPGTLAHYLRPYGLARNLSHWLGAHPETIGPAEAHQFLWPYKPIPGLSVLFGPQSTEECKEIGRDHAQAVCKVLAAMADYVVIDLPASLSDANRALVESADFLAIIVERDPICVQSARFMAKAIESLAGVPQPIEMVIVNRAALGAPMPLPEIDQQLGRHPLGVLPPEPDLCLAAQHAHAPLVAVQPESLLAGALTALAEKLAVVRQ